jgi:hypothetical protein
MPRNILNLRLSTSQSEGRLEINERFSGLVVVENELVLSA